MELKNQTGASVVEGYSFFNEEDAKKAASERKRIDFIEERIDYSKPESVLTIYKKAIQERVFKTPVGFLYLKNMQDFLMAQAGINHEDVPPIPLYQTFDGTLRKQTEPTQTRIRPSAEKDEKPQLLTVSVVLNVVFVIAIIAMFVIALKSEQPNVFNYEKALVDRYAGWEQELTQREQAVREKERQLSIEENK